MNELQKHIGQDIDVPAGDIGVGPGPVTPWGKPALGYKTRAKHKSSDKFIVKRRNAK